MSINTKEFYSTNNITFGEALLGDARVLPFKGFYLTNRASNERHILF